MPLATTSDDFEVVPFGQLRERRVRLALVPAADGGDVVLKRQIAPLAAHRRAPPERLDRRPQVLLEADRVHHVPAVHAEPLLAAIEAVRLDHLRQAEERRREDPILSGRKLEVPGAAEVVLRAGAAEGGEFAIPVQVELDLPLPPPAAV